MNMNHNDIKQELIDNWEQITEATYPEDIVSSFVESALPVYYNEIIKDWQEMPNDYTDIWKLEGYEGKQITDLMIYDLWRYYSDKYHTIYHEILEEKEELENA